MSDPKAPTATEPGARAPEAIEPHDPVASGPTSESVASEPVATDSFAAEPVAPEPVATEDIAPEPAAARVARGQPRGPGGPIEPRRRTSFARWKPALLFLAVFLLGGVAGVFVSRAFFFGELRSVMRGPPGGAMLHMRVDALRRHLDLSDEQVTRLRSILDEGDASLAEHMARCGPEMQSLREGVDARIREILTPGQREAYAKYTERAPWRRHGGGPGGAGGPGGRPPRAPGSVGP